MNFENLILSQAAPPKTNPPKWERGVGADGVVKVDTRMHRAPTPAHDTIENGHVWHSLTARAPN